MNQPHAIKKRSTLWIVLGAALLLAGGLCVERYLEYGRTAAREQERLFTQARVIEKNLSWNLDSVNRVLASLQADRSWQAGERGIAGRLQTLTDAMPGVRTLSFVDALGTVRASNRPQLVGRNFREREYFSIPRLHPDPQTLFVSPPYRTSLGVLAINLVRTVSGPRGEFAGVVAATLDPEYFTTLLSSVLYAGDMRAVVAHGDGLLFMLVPARQQLLGRSLNWSGSFFSRHRDSGRESSVLSGLDHLTGSRRLFVLRSVRPAGLKLNQPLVVSVSRELDAVYRDWRQQNLLWGGLFTLLASACALALYAYRRRQLEFERQAAGSALLLKESAERLRMATSAAGVGVWDYHPQTDQLLWDDSMFALYGIDKQGFSWNYQAWRDAVLPEELPALEAALRAAIGGREPFNHTFRIHRGDGELRSMRCVGQVSSCPDGTALRVVGVSEDVTERRAAAEVLQRATASADAANRAKTEFLANMSHEIRTPMNAILGLIYLLQKTGLNPRQWDYTDKVQDAATSLLDILNDILDFSKVEAGRIELEQVPFRLDDLLRNMSVILAANAQQKDIEVLFDVAADVPDCLVGDPLRLQQVLINLAGNAVKFTDSGEVVLGFALSRRSAERVELTVSIRDTGIGIAADNLERIFEGFTQAEVSTSRLFGGTGLGLAISSRLVRLMGGEIGVTSERGKGSVFRFSVGFGLEAGDRQLPSPARVAALHPVRLLVVDDNATAREVLARMVATAGWSADLAVDGQRALQLLEAALARGQKPDALLIDWRLPGVQGVEAGQKLRRLCREQGIPLIVLVTPFGRETIAEARPDHRRPAEGFLLKPMTHAMLRDAVAEGIRGYPLIPSRRDRTLRRRFQGLRILLVEDNKVNQLVAREILEDEGAQVVVADNGREAVARLRERTVSFDAVLMDLQMPVMDGYQATREIRNELGELELPVIAMTANAFETDRQRCLEAGLNAHLSKPIQVEVLAETLGRFCRLDQPQPADDQEDAEFTLDAAEIAGLPGLDLADTLRRLNGNRPLYSQIARMVCNKYPEVAAEVRRFLSAGESAAAGQLLHTFKGVVLNMGAFGLGEAIVLLEKAVWQEDQEAVRLQLPGFEALAAEALDSLLIVAERYGEPAEPAGEAAGPAGSAPLDTLQQLMALLEESNMEAVDSFASFRREFGPLLPAERILWIGEAIAQLDFCAALEYCSVLNSVLKGDS